METDMTIVTLVTGWLGQDWYNMVGQVVAGATVITMGFKSKFSNPALNGLVSALNFLAGNVFKNKNKE